MAGIQHWPYRAVLMYAERSIRIHLADLIGAPVPVLRLPSATYRAPVAIHAEADPCRRQGYLEVVLEFVAAPRAALERLPSIAIDDALMVMAAQPAEECLPTLNQWATEGHSVTSALWQAAFLTSGGSSACRRYVLTRLALTAPPLSY